MSWIVIAALIGSGLVVGFINTLAGGATIISLSLFMLLGLPANVANGTNRIAVFFQTLVSVGSFKKQKVLDTRKGLILSIPTVIGSVIGARIAIEMNEKIIERAFAVIMLVMLFFVLYKPQLWLKGSEKVVSGKMKPWQVILFFFIGIYGGFVHVGVGYFILAGVVLGAGYDLVKANALKVLIVLAYVPFTLVIFMWNGQVNYTYGLIHAIGNVIGAYVASKIAVNKGVNFIRWFMVAIIIIFSAQLLGLIDFKSWISHCI
jgi:hypothetical protein